MMKKVLSRVGKGGVDIDKLAQGLDIGMGTLNAILEMSVARGYIEKVDVSSSCSGCPLSSECKMKLSDCDKTEVYVLTPKGEKYVG